MIIMIQGALIGMIGGFLAGLLGVGGGFIMVPLLVLFMGLEQQIAQGISLLVIIPTSLIALWRLQKNKMVDWHTAIVMAFGSIIGTSVTSNYVQYIPAGTLTKVFGFCVILVGLKMFYDGVKTKEKVENKRG